MPRWPAWLEVALLPLLLAWIVADAAWLLPSPNWGSRSLQSLLMALVLINLLRQGLAARGQPRVLRAVGGTALLLLCGTTMLILLLELLPIWRIMPPASQALIYTFVLVSNLGIALATRRLRPYELDDWTSQAFVALAGAVGVWALYRGLVTLRVMEDSVALIVALLVCWLLYVPLFRWLSRSYLKRAQPSLEDLTGEILLMGLIRPADRLAAWRGLLARLFNCRCLDADAVPQPVADPARATLLPGGEVLWIPATAGVPALLLRDRFYSKGLSTRLQYATIGVLFVNVSIGGTLTPYAAPPVLMVAATWGWDSAFMLTTFGWKAALAVLVNATACALALRRHLPSAEALRAGQEAADQRPVPVSVAAVHIALLAGVVLFAHHPVVFLGIFLMFLGYTQAYARHQSPLILKEALLVGFFLAGLVVLGGMQQWWLQPIVAGLEPLALFAGALGLTAITDNAALTYLGSLIQGITPAAQYMLVAGAVAGGGLTVIANAPNPAGYSILKGSFEHEEVSALGLFAAALIPTLVAIAAFRAI